MGDDRLRYPRRIASAAAPAQAPAPDPGRTSSSSQLPPAGRATQGGLWGPYSAGLSSSTVQHKIGNDFVDDGVACEGAPAGTPGCILNPGQRSRIIPTYQGRVNAAYAAYLAALQVCRVEELMRKETEKADWFFEIMLDVVGIVVSNSIKNIAALIAAGHTDGIAEVVSDVAAVAHEAGGAGAHLEHAIGAGVGAAKQKAIAAHAAHKPEMSAKKRATIGYLDMLGQAASVIFEYLRENAIANVSDSALVIAFDSFRASNGHSIGDYKNEVTGKLDRFKDSGLHMTGVQENETFSALDMQIGIGGPDSWQHHETKAFWVKTPMGQRLGLYRRGHRPVERGLVGAPGSSKRHEMTDEEFEAEKAKDLKDRPFVFWRFVPREFESVALQMHSARWSDTPGDHTCGIDEIAQMGSP